MRTLLNKNLDRLENLKTEEADLVTGIAEAKKKIDHLTEAQQIMQEGAKMSQEHLALHLSSIVTHALQAVIGKPYEFVCEFVERRGATEADLFLRKDNQEYDILDSTGGGLADVCSFALKVAYLLLSDVDRVLIIDEVSRHINSSEQKKAFAEVLVHLSSEFNIQLVLNTTIPELLAISDNTINLSLTEEDVTYVS